MVNFVIKNESANFVMKKLLHYVVLLVIIIE